ncbi:unnamed protein product [marine sediment metagenome]|uniref:Uncharacterized protein n=1 Tax=marine sediment metagenome TaxID=412755 RepID=X1QGK0_9ZZZZ
MLEEVLVRILRANRSYREVMSQQYKNWVESMYISKAEFSEDSFGTDYQTLSKTYAPVKKAGDHTLAVVTGHQNDFSGKTNTLLEIVITTAGTPDGTAKFKWRKQTFLGGTWGDWTENQTADADVTVTDGIHVNFNDDTYSVDDRWHVQACGSWHTPENGVDSYLTSLFVYPYDTDKTPKAGFFRAWCGDYRMVDYITNQGEFPNWRTPIHLLGDGIEQFKVELAEIAPAGDIAHIFCVMKGWDEQ